MSLATFALSAMSSVASFAQKQQEADAQTERYNQNVQNALAAGRDQHNQLALRQMQEQRADSQKQHVMNLEGAEKAAEVSVSAAGGGVGGLSVDALLSDIRRKTAMNRATMSENYKMTAAQLQAQNKAVVNQEQSRINSMAPGSDPSPLGMVGEIVGSGLKAYGNYESRRGVG